MLSATKKNFGKLPSMLTWVILAMLILPFLFNMLGIVLISLVGVPSEEPVATAALQQAQVAWSANLSNTLAHAVFDWTALSLAFITLFLAMIYHKIKKNVAIPIICLALFFSGVFDAFHISIAKQLITGDAHFERLLPFSWLTARIFNAAILTVGVSIFIFQGMREHKLSPTIFTSVLIILGAATYALMLSVATSDALPQVHYYDFLIKHPYAVIPMGVYLIGLLFMYPRFHSIYRGYFAKALICTAMTEVIFEICIMFNLVHLKSGFYVGYLFKLLTYVLPLAGLLIDYINVCRKQQFDLMKKTERLEMIANVDPVTGLHTRHAFDRELKKNMRHAQRFNNKFALLVVDIDNFKAINDELDEATSNQLLKKISECLIDSVGTIGVLSRISGAHFAIIITEIEGYQQSAVIASRILEMLKLPISAEFGNFNVEASIGIACFPRAGSDVNQLYQCADHANKMAKKRGQYQWQYSSEVFNRKYNEKLQLANALRVALANHEFMLVYQPQFDLVTSAVVGVEVLLRWQHPTFGLVSPELFIPIAEEINIIYDIGCWVLTQACLQYQQWFERYPICQDSFSFAINVSPKQLPEKKFIPYLKDLLKRHSFPVANITLELTESAIMSHTVLLDNLQAIANLGVHISIDDFGTGYSSLSFLRRLPVDGVKIDKSFICDVPQDKDGVKLLKSIIAMLHNLNLKVVTEGVETEQQKQFLLENHAPIMQGYLMSKALSANNMEKLLMNAKGH